MHCESTFRVKKTRKHIPILALFKGTDMKKVEVSARFDAKKTSWKKQTNEYKI